MTKAGYKSSSSSKVNMETNGISNGQRYNNLNFYPHRNGHSKLHEQDSQELRVATIAALSQQIKGKGRKKNESHECTTSLL